MQIFAIAAQHADRHACGVTIYVNLVIIAGMLELLQTSGALTEAEKFDQSLQSSSSSSTAGAAGSAWLPVEDVVSDSAAEKAATEAGGLCCRPLYGVLWCSFEHVVHMVAPPECYQSCC
jgi:hypothetical protein